jgi:hypothetical protein
MHKIRYDVNETYHIWTPPDAWIRFDLQMMDACDIIINKSYCLLICWMCMV